MALLWARELLICNVKTVVCGLVLVGLFATPIFGEVSMKLACSAASFLIVIWLVDRLISELRKTIKKKQWREAVIISFEYLVALSIAAAAFVGFSQSIQ